MGDFSRRIESVATPMSSPTTSQQVDADRRTASRNTRLNFGAPPSRELLMHVRMLEMANKRQLLQQILDRPGAREACEPAAVAASVARETARNPLAARWLRYAFDVVAILAQRTIRRLRSPYSLEKAASGQ
jgi:hypothetical protein